MVSKQIELLVDFVSEYWGVSQKTVSPQILQLPLLLCIGSLEIGLYPQQLCGIDKYKKISVLTQSSRYMKTKKLKKHFCSGPLQYILIVFSETPNGCTLIILVKL